MKLSEYVVSSPDIMVAPQTGHSKLLVDSNFVKLHVCIHEFIHCVSTLFMVLFAWYTWLLAYSGF